MVLKCQFRDLSRYTELRECSNIYNYCFSSGESSVDRVLAGKHYNYAIRTLQYLYDGISRLRIEHFENWLNENEYPALNKFTSTDEFQSCLKEVCFFICLFVCLLICVCLFIYIFVCLYVCVFVCFVCLFIHFRFVD